MLAPITTTLQDIQKKLQEILHPRTVLIGHSLDSDLKALKLTHPFIIDTALLYPHPRGPPLKSSLKWLAQRYLNREIQRGHGTAGPAAGHNSIEDARTCLDLVKQKCEKGKEWGTSDSAGENIFKRIGRSGVSYKNRGGQAISSLTGGKSSAAVDWGDPRKGAGAAATFVIGCKTDEEVMEGVIRAVNGDADGKEIPGGGVDFVWARMRELEYLKGWRPGSEAVGNEEKLATAPDIQDASIEDVQSGEVVVDGITPSTEGENGSLGTKASGSTSTAPPITLDTAIADLTRRLTQIHASLPPCTALIVFSGSGDPREMSRLQAMHLQYRREFNVKKWDQLSVKWTDNEAQALRRAVRQARNGIGFVGVK